MTSTMRRALLPVLLGCAATAQAADPIATDRPGFPFSSATVAPGRLQLESSVAWEAGDAQGRYATPVVFRAGLAPDWELRLSTAGRLHDTAVDHGQWADVAIGVKRHVAATPLGASVAWIAQVDLATGHGAPGRGARPSVGLVGEWSLAGGRSLALAQGLAMERDASGRGVVGSIGALFGQPIGTQSRVYAELAATRIAIDADGPPSVIAGIGGSRLIGTDMQVDLGYSAGLSSAAPDHAIAFGLSRRW